MPLSASLSKFFIKCIVNFSSSLQISFKVTKVSFFVYFLGKYRGAAHNACNLLLEIDPRQHVTPVVFHNFCVYLSSFFTLNSVDLVSLGLANTCPSFILADCFISPSFSFSHIHNFIDISHTLLLSSLFHPPLTHTHTHTHTSILQLFYISLTHHTTHNLYFLLCYSLISPSSES